MSHSIINFSCLCEIIHAQRGFIARFALWIYIWENSNHDINIICTICRDLKFATQISPILTYNNIRTDIPKRCFVYFWEVTFFCLCIKISKLFPPHPNLNNLLKFSWPILCHDVNLGLLWNTSPSLFLQLLLKSLGNIFGVTYLTLLCRRGGHNNWHSIKCYNDYKICSEMKIATNECYFLALVMC